MTDATKTAEDLLDKIVAILQAEEWQGLPGASVIPMLRNELEAAWAEGDKYGQRLHAEAVDLVNARADRNAREREAAEAERDALRALLREALAVIPPDAPLRWYKNDKLRDDIARVLGE